MTNHPITPPPELVARWKKHWFDAKIKHIDLEYYMLAQAAQWGWIQRWKDSEGELQEARDEELEACCEWTQGYAECGDALRLARRPKLPTAKELALHELGDAYDKGKIDDTTYDTIRKALEALPND